MDEAKEERASGPTHNFEFDLTKLNLKAENEELKETLRQLRTELEDERNNEKHLRREQQVDTKLLREEERRKAQSLVVEVRRKLYKEKQHEMSELRERLQKEKEKDIAYIIKQKDEEFRKAQQNWNREKEGLTQKLRVQIANETREEVHKNYEKQVRKLEAHIDELKEQKKQAEGSCKLVHDADKRKAGQIRRIHSDHENELAKLKRSSWQEGRKQMAEIRQLINIIHHLEKKLGVESGHYIRLQMEKDSLRDKLDRVKGTDISGRSSPLLMKSDLSSDLSVFSFPSRDDSNPLWLQLKQQKSTIAYLRQNLQDKSRRIDLLKQKLFKSRGAFGQGGLMHRSMDDMLSYDTTADRDECMSPQFGYSTGSSDTSSIIDDSIQSEENQDSEIIRRLRKQLLTLEKAYSLLQAQTESGLDAKRNQLEREQLQTDLIDTQKTIDELNKELAEAHDRNELLEFQLQETLQRNDNEDYSKSRFNIPTLCVDYQFADEELECSVEEVKAKLEELENEKKPVLSRDEQLALLQARILLENIPKEQFDAETYDFEKDSLLINDTQDGLLELNGLVSVESRDIRTGPSDVGVQCELVELKYEVSDCREELRILHQGKAFKEVRTGVETAAQCQIVQIKATQNGEIIEVLDESVGDCLFRKVAQSYHSEVQTDFSEFNQELDNPMETSKRSEDASSEGIEGTYPERQNFLERGRGIETAVQCNIMEMKAHGDDDVVEIVDEHSEVWRFKKVGLAHDMSVQTDFSESDDFCKNERDSAVQCDIIQMKAHGEDDVVEIVDEHSEVWRFKKVGLAHDMSVQTDFSESDGDFFKNEKESAVQCDIIQMKAHGDDEVVEIVDERSEVWRFKKVGLAHDMSVQTDFLESDGDLDKNGIETSVQCDIIQRKAYNGEEIIEILGENFESCRFRKVVATHDSAVQSDSLDKDTNIVPEGKSVLATKEDSMKDLDIDNNLENDSGIDSAVQCNIIELKSFEDDVSVEILYDSGRWRFRKVLESRDSDMQTDFLESQKLLDDNVKRDEVPELDEENVEEKHDGEVSEKSMFGQSWKDSIDQRELNKDGRLLDCVVYEKEDILVVICESSRKYCKEVCIDDSFHELGDNVGFLNKSEDILGKYDGMPTIDEDAPSDDDVKCDVGIQCNMPEAEGILADQTADACVQCELIVTTTPGTHSDNSGDIEHSLLVPGGAGDTVPRVIKDQNFLYSATAELTDHFGCQNRNEELADSLQQINRTRESFHETRDFGTQCSIDSTGSSEKDILCLYCGHAQLTFVDTGVQCEFADLLSSASCMLDILEIPSVLQEPDSGSLIKEVMELAKECSQNDALIDQHLTEVVISQGLYEGFQEEEDVTATDVSVQCEILVSPHSCDKETQCVVQENDIDQIQEPDSGSLIKEVMELAKECSQNDALIDQHLTEVVISQGLYEGFQEDEDVTATDVSVQCEILVSPHSCDKETQCAVQENDTDQIQEYTYADVATQCVLEDYDDSPTKAKLSEQSNHIALQCSILKSAEQIDQGTQWDESRVESQGYPIHLENSVLCDILVTTCDKEIQCTVSVEDDEEFNDIGDHDILASDVDLDNVESGDDVVYRDLYSEIPNSELPGDTMEEDGHISLNSDSNPGTSRNPSYDEIVSGDDREEHRKEHKDMATQCDGSLGNSDKAIQCDLLDDGQRFGASGFGRGNEEFIQDTFGDVENSDKKTDSILPVSSKLAIEGVQTGTVCELEGPKDETSLTEKEIPKEIMFELTSLKLKNEQLLQQVVELKIRAKRPTYDSQLDEDEVNVRREQPYGATSVLTLPKALGFEVTVTPTRLDVLEEESQHKDDTAVQFIEPRIVAEEAPVFYLDIDFDNVFSEMEANPTVPVFQRTLSPQKGYFSPLSAGDATDDTTRSELESLAKPESRPPADELMINRTCKDESLDALDETFRALEDGTFAEEGFSGAIRHGHCVEGLEQGLGDGTGNKHEATLDTPVANEHKLLSTESPTPSEDNQCTVDSSDGSYPQLPISDPPPIPDSPPPIPDSPPPTLPSLAPPGALENDLDEDIEALLAEEGNGLRATLDHEIQALLESEGSSVTSELDTVLSMDSLCITQTNVVPSEASPMTHDAFDVFNDDTPCNDDISATVDHSFVEAFLNNRSRPEYDHTQSVVTMETKLNHQENASERHVAFRHQDALSDSSSVSADSGQQRKHTPPPVMPKPKYRSMSMNLPLSELPRLPAHHPNSMAAQRDMVDGHFPPPGLVPKRASEFNLGEFDLLKERIVFLERQLKNKENLLQSMRAEATEIETNAYIQKKEQDLKIMDESVRFLKLENQKKERELIAKIADLNKCSFELEQCKSDSATSEKQRKKMEDNLDTLQAQLNHLQSVNMQFQEIKCKYAMLEKENGELQEQVNRLHRADEDFVELERTISKLQAKLKELEDAKRERDEFSDQLKAIKTQKDDLVQKGRIVETQRNDFLMNNKLMEQQKENLEARNKSLQRTNDTFKTKISSLEKEFRDTQRKLFDVQRERDEGSSQLRKLDAERNELRKRVNELLQCKSDLKQSQSKSHDLERELKYLHGQCKKLEAERTELSTELGNILKERNRLEARTAEFEQLSRGNEKLEEKFHTLKLKIAELTSQRDDAEVQLPTLKAKVALLKKACKEKDEQLQKMKEEIQELKHSIATSALDDLSKIRTYGFSSPENFVKFGGNSDVNNNSSQVASKKSEKGEKYVVLFDYDPSRLSTTGHPEKELKLNEGDVVTVHGDMDLNGYYMAELDGAKGLVSSLYIEEMDEYDLRKETKRRESQRDHKSSPKKPSISLSPPRTSTTLPELVKRSFVALQDYNPFTSSTSSRPNLEIPLTAGEVVTVVGDVDTNGYYTVEHLGRLAIIPSNLVKPSSPSSVRPRKLNFSGPVSKTEQAPSMAPTQTVLGSSGVNGFSGPPPSHSSVAPMATPQGVLGSSGTNGYSGPPPFHSSVAPTQGVFGSSGTNGYSGPTLHSSVAPTQGVFGSSGTNGFSGPPPFHSSMAPTQGVFGSSSVNGFSGPTPHSSVVPRQSTAEFPVTSTTSYGATEHVLRQSSVENIRNTRNHPAVGDGRATNGNKSLIIQPGLPAAPRNLRVLRCVNKDGLLLGWVAPEIDEMGRNNGQLIKGYKILANGQTKLDVDSPYMAKALIENLDLSRPIELSIQTVAENGFCSEKALTHFNEAVMLETSSVSTEEVSTVDDGTPYKTFVALYTYDPIKNSPNPNPTHELQFQEGDILRILDASRPDGFYLGQVGGNQGLVPSNFIEEIAVAARHPNSMGHKEHAKDKDFHGSNVSLLSNASSSSLRKAKVMVAIYDYDPSTQSPNDLPNHELSFKKGQIIRVYGSMRSDGFYEADINGEKGLVPSSFLKACKRKSLKSSAHSSNGYASLPRRVQFVNHQEARHVPTGFV